MLQTNDFAKHINSLQVNASSKQVALLFGLPKNSRTISDWAKSNKEDCARMSGELLVNDEEKLALKEEIKTLKRSLKGATTPSL